MKNFSFTAVVLLSSMTFFSFVATAQAPQKMSYQSVLRNSSNVLLANTAVGIKISVLQGSASGTAVYVETQTATTNGNGLVSLQIGTGTATTGTFAGINWASGPYFIKTETDPSGGSNYSIMGTQEMLSVPYAMYAANSINDSAQSASITALQAQMAALLNYGSVLIDSQYWMEKNLEVTTYRNGDIIPNVTDPTAWAALTTGAWCYYDNDPSSGYGKLYNWYAVNDSRGLAPLGYHIPTDAEWTTLRTALGSENVAGGKMKTIGTTRWITPNTGATNESGFAGLPGGYRAGDDGVFNFVGNYGLWWSATEIYTTNAWYRMLYYNGGDLNRINNRKSDGYSVRCLRD